MLINTGFMGLVPLKYIMEKIERDMKNEELDHLRYATEIIIIRGR